MGDDRGHLRATFDSAADLYSEIRRRLGSRGDGRLGPGWGAVLHVARRLDTPTAL